MRKAIAFGVFLLVLMSCSQVREPSSQVNVFNGTGLAGNTYPGATVPFGAIQLSPDTDKNRASGYHYDDKSILGFSHNHLSGTGCPDLGDFLFTPTLGDKAEPLPFTHEDEKAYPGYYRVDFSNGITAELTAAAHTGAHRYTFTGPGVPKILVDAQYCIGGWSLASKAILIQDGPQSLTGERNTTGWAHGRDGYFSAEFSVPFEKVEEIEEGKLLLTFPEGTKEVTVLAGLSGVSVENAKANRLAEASGASFDDILAAAKASWKDALGSIKVEGGPTDVFYTNFYHTFITPNIISDVDGSYRDLSGRNRKAEEGRGFYSTLSIWDTFRSWHPLQTLLNTKLSSDIIVSLLDMYDCYGKIPIWPLASYETGCMIGYHNASVIADAWLRGIRDFDGEKALDAMVKTSNLNEVNSSELYVQYGYLPADLKTEAVSKTLEFAYDDWCIAKMAESLGHKDIADEYYRRALSYRAIFDPVTGFMRGKKANGNWVVPFDPLSGSRDYTEATPWQYRFFVPHDVAGMEALMGGRENMLAAVDSFFTYTPEGHESVDAGIGGMMGQYAQGNEPGHTLPWLFYWLGEPSKSQKVVRDLLTETYSAEPGGICGNEDCGQMGAWYVLASLGIYPACPGSGEYILTAPMFKRSEIRLWNGKSLIITADNPKYAYVSSVTLNGEPLNSAFLTYDQIMAGGELDFKLSAKPDHSRDNIPAPYSMTTVPIVSKPSITGDLHLFNDTAEVTMTCRNEGAVIRYTLDGSEPTESSLEYTGPFEVGESCLIRAKAFKDGFQPSPTEFITAHKAFFYPVADRSGMKPGCRYTYHTANFMVVGQIEADPAEDSGVMKEPSIASAPDEDHFAYCFTGFIDIPEDGIWHFALTSDDGSELYIEGERVVNNDGSHSAVTATGKIPLQKGLHPYKLLYFEDYEGQELTWGWKKDGAAEFTPIPTNRLFYR